MIEDLWSKLIFVSSKRINSLLFYRAPSHLDLMSSIVLSAKPCKKPEKSLPDVFFPILEELKTMKKNSVVIFFHFKGKYQNLLVLENISSQILSAIAWRDFMQNIFGPFVLPRSLKGCLCFMQVNFMTGSKVSSGWWPNVFHVVSLYPGDFSSKQIVLPDPCLFVIVLFFHKVSSKV